MSQPNRVPRPKEKETMRMSSNQRVAAAAESVRLIVEADRGRVATKLKRLDARLAAGDLHLKNHRDSVARHLSALGGGR